MPAEGTREAGTALADTSPAVSPAAATGMADMGAVATPMATTAIVAIGTADTAAGTAVIGADRSTAGTARTRTTTVASIRMTRMTTDIPTTTVVRASLTEPGRRHPNDGDHLSQKWLRGDL